jgi:hypothetical protein
MRRQHVHERGLPCRRDGAQMVTGWRQELLTGVGVTSRCVQQLAGSRLVDTQNATSARSRCEPSCANSSLNISSGMHRGARRVCFGRYLVTRATRTAASGCGAHSPLLSPPRRGPGTLARRSETRPSKGADSGFESQARRDLSTLRARLTAIPARPATPPSNWTPTTSCPTETDSRC